MWKILVFLVLCQNSVKSCHIEHMCFLISKWFLKSFLNLVQTASLYLCNFLMHKIAQKIAIWKFSKTANMSYIRRVFFVSRTSKIFPKQRREQNKRFEIWISTKRKF